MDGLSINESEYALEDGSMAKIAVFIYTGSADPGKILDWAIFKYTKGSERYHELMDANMDNPWMRVVMSDINNMKQQPFSNYLLSLERDKNIKMIIDEGCEN